MSKAVSKTINLTVVSYSIIEVNDGVPQFVPMPDLQLKGNVPEKRVRRILTSQMGNTQFVITKIAPGRYTYAMSLEDFLSRATVMNFIPAGTAPASDADGPAEDSAAVPDV